MKGIIADANIQGQVDGLVAIMQTEPWKLFWDHLKLRHVRFSEIGLAHDAPDSQIWDACQQHELVLITDNRNDDGPDSLEATIRARNTASSLPVLTIANVPHLGLSRLYAEQVVDRLLDFLGRMESLRGHGPIVPSLNCGKSAGVVLMANSPESRKIEACVLRLRAGDDEARKQLLGAACERLTQLTHQMLKKYPRVRRWEDTSDVVQNALLRLHRTLAEVQPASAVEFYRLAALNIRRELLDLAKHYYGPRGLGANHASVIRKNDQDQDLPAPALDPPTSGEDAVQMEAWVAFHEQVERLPAEDKEVFDLLWYQELSQAEAAALLNISERTVKRRWASARQALQQAVQAQLLDD